MRKKRMVKMFIFLFILMSLCSTTFALEKIDIDLNTAVERALENNLDLKIAKINLKKVKLEYQQNKAGNLSNVSRYKDLKAEINLKSAENTYQNTEHQVITDTLKQYTNLWLSAYQLKIKTKQVEVNKLLVEEAEAQYKIGDIGTTDLLEDENNYSDAKVSLETAINDYQQDIRELQRGLGLEGEQKPILADLELSDSWQVTEDQAVSTALKNSLALVLKEKNLELAQIDGRRAKISAAELDKKVKEQDITAARLDQKNARNDLKSSVQEAYYDYQEAIKKISLNKDIWHEYQQKYKLRKKQYDLGLLTKTDVMQYEVSVMEAEYNYISAIANYYLTKQALQQEMSLQSGVLQNETVENK